MACFPRLTAKCKGWVGVGAAIAAVAAFSAVTAQIVAILSARGTLREGHGIPDDADGDSSILHSL